MPTNSDIPQADPTDRQRLIVDVLVDHFSDLMEADPEAFRTKFRKMARDPFSFYRGSACLFYADMADAEDRWADERTSRIWIQGDLHAENFGTYMDGTGRLVFDVNDFDEAYLGHFTWDVKRLAASVALMSWQKALPDEAIARLLETYARAYVDQVHFFVEEDNDHLYALRLDTTDGAVHEILRNARLATRLGLLNSLTVVDDYERRFRRSSGVRDLDDGERAKVEAAFERYLGTIPEHKRRSEVFYDVKDVVGKSGFGIGSAGLPAYNILIEGHTQALENDVVVSMKQGNVAAPSRIVADERIRRYFSDHGHRTSESQRALQAHADPLLGHAQLDGTGFVVSELSPYVTDLEWGELSEPDEMAPVLDCLGRATAKVHCVSDEDSDSTLVDFQVEDAIVAAIGDAAEDFARDMARFGMAYAEVTRQDHALFVDAFRAGQIPGVAAT